MYKFIFIATAFLFVSCNGQDTVEGDDNSQTKEWKSEVAATMNEALEKKRLTTEANIDKFDIANGLSFTHNDGSTEEVFAYLGKNQSIKKIEERFSDGKTGNVGVRIFYLENGKKFLSIERFADNVKAEGMYRERLSYYDSDAKVISTMERLAQFEEDLENQTFVEVSKFDCSMLTAEQVLNNKGVFATTFQGFVTGGNLDYLVVGGPGETGYTSALAIQYEDELIKKLKSNEKAFVNRELTVQFEKMLDERDLEFQVLLGLEMD